MDGLMIRYDSAGDPIGLIVSEAKYGTSRLSTTSDGIQMGIKWRSVRLARMAAEYRHISDSIRAGRMKIAGVGGSVGKQRLQIPLADGKAAVFTRASKGAPWEFVGPQESIARAGRQAELVGDCLQQASEGRFAYESSIYRVELNKGTMRVTIRDATSLGETGTESGLPIRKTISIPLRGARLQQLRAMSQAEIAKLIRQEYPGMVSADVDHYSRAIVRSTRDLESLFSTSPRSLASTIALNIVKIGGIMTAFDVAVQAIGEYRHTGRVDWRRVAISGGITFIGTTAGSAADQGAMVVITKNPIAYQFMHRTSQILGIGSTSLATSVLGGAVGSGVATLLFAYGGYFAGLYDLETANRMVVSGGAGLITGGAFGVGLLSLASAVGTASTGTAINTLYGIAATNATYAWLGGGSLAAGGFGVAGGTVLFWTGVGTVAVCATIAIYSWFNYLDAKQDLQRIRLTIDELRSRTSFSRDDIGAQRFQLQTILRP
jgi:hypothetical protein